MLLQFIKFHKSKGTFNIYTMHLFTPNLTPLCYLQPNHIFHFLIKKPKNLKGIMVSKIISNYRI